MTNPYVVKFSLVLCALVMWSNCGTGEVLERMQTFISLEGLKIECFFPHIIRQFGTD